MTRPDYPGGGTFVALFVATIVLRFALTAAAQEEWKTEMKDIEIPMRDGKSLAADVYLPPKPGKYPAVLIQTPYNKKNMGAPISGTDSKSGDVGRGSVSDTLGLLDREHYVYAVVDWRGFYVSKKAMDGVNKRKWRRGQDGFDCVEWLAKQEFCNGKIGTWGGSALGKQQFDTAFEHPPHLVCCVPLIAGMGQRYESYYEGGIMLEHHIKMMDFLGYGVSTFVNDNPRPGTVVWKYAERMSYKPQDIEVPCLMISGWWDHFPDQVLKTFVDIVAEGGEKARANSKLLMGPWDHVSVGLAKQGDVSFELAEKASAQAAKAFFDHWLLGLDNGWEKTARVRYWQSNEEKWYEAESWEGIKRETVTLFLHTDGTIDPSRDREGAAKDGPEPGSEGKADPEQKDALTRHYVHDPEDPTPTLGGANLPPAKHGPTDQRPLEKRKDVIVYSTGPLDKPLRVNGNVELSFDFIVNRPSCDFTARLCELREDGKSILVADAAQRCKSLEPGKKSRVTLRFPATAYTFPKGRELRVYLSSSNSPRYERNPHTGADHWDAKTALDLDVTIHHENAELKLPVRGD
ncbi:MAG: CocE/NonD family hydrolase [Planctomycetota bacterium]|nr:CocE/NonD family hydrolase [Planctomycetota bacterium]